MMNVNLVILTIKLEKMTLDEAIKEINIRPVNQNLNYFICKWNDGYCINLSSYMKRNPHIEYIYSTENLISKTIK